MNPSFTSSNLLTSNSELVDEACALSQPELDVETRAIVLEPILQDGAVSLQDAENAKERSLQCEVKIFASTFLTIFLAELGDKTQLTTLLMSAESQSPWIVFAGAGAALVLTSLIGILLGRWLATKISPKTLDFAAGMLLLVISAMLFLDILHG